MIQSGVTKEDSMKKIAWLTGLSTFVVFVLFIVIVLPGEAAKSAALGLEGSPDTSFFYTADQLYDTCEQYGEAGRSFYIEQRFSFDLFWPLVYGAFLTTSLAFLGQRASTKRRMRWFYLPILAVAFDYLENIMTATVMRRYPLETMILADLAGFMTSIKWITLSLSFVVFLAVLGIHIHNRFRKRKTL
jgi:hypothetical protein